MNLQLFPHHYNLFPTSNSHYQFNSNPQADHHRQRDVESRIGDESIRNTMAKSFGKRVGHVRIVEYLNFDRMRHDQVLENFI